MASFSSSHSRGIVDQFLSRVPRDIGESFTAEQLDAIKLAFGAREMGCHTIEIRKSIPLIWRRFYIVFLVGKGNRCFTGWQFAHAVERAKCIFFALLIVAFLIPVVGAGAAGLYAVKSSLNLNIFPQVDVLPDKDIKEFLFGRRRNSY